MTLEEFLAPLLEEAAQQPHLDDAARFLLSVLTTCEEYDFPVLTEHNAPSLSARCSVYWLLETQTSPARLHLSLLTATDTLIKQSLTFDD
ncbi:MULTISPECIES: hypothetical protein [unclassified Vibrio]|uniref:Uncharacterized protein n=1 Tax=Vibrio sp. HB236076 TaxID=3232307 RepID=A0AB39HFL3_9VIBR|nr:hypothetical protein [Vibrio sp. HB161653]MDP5255390.1 hypothetical protein [Vibrio sp. HB161653]